MKDRRRLVVLMALIVMLLWPLALRPDAARLARAASNLAAVIAQDGQPNLTVTVSTTPANPDPGTPVVIKVQVTNSGTAEAPAGFRVKLLVNPNSVPTEANQSIDTSLNPAQVLDWVVAQALPASQNIILSSDTSAIAPQEQYSSWSGKFLPGSTSLAVYADSYSDDGSPNGAVVESNENDNSATLSLLTPGSGSTPPSNKSQQLFVPLVGASVGASQAGFANELSFRPQPNGFSFENYGGPTNRDAVLTIDDVVKLFGRSNVCQNPDPASGACILTGDARDWRDKEAKGLDGGQCYGMAVTASRFYERSDDPARFTTGAATTFDIKRSPEVERHVAYYFITQSLQPENAALGGWIEGKKPSEYIQLLREGFGQGKSFVIGFFKRDKSGGHAVTPYAVKDMGNNIVRLFIYDNNWPSQERYFEFNLADETWRYDFGTTKPGEPVDLYEGDSRTNTFQIRSISSHPESGWQCPFCKNQNGAALAQAISDTLTFDFNGEGRMLVIDPAGKRLGYNPATRKSLQEIGNAEEQPFLGGLGKDIPPTIELPRSGTISDSYKVVLSGNELTAASQGDLTVSSDGYVVGLEGITLQPNQEITLTLRADLEQLAVESNISTTVGLSIAYKASKTAANSYIVKVDDVPVPAGDRLSMLLGQDNKLIVRNSGGQTTNYDLRFIKIDDKAGDEVWSRNDFGVADGDDFELDFSQWDDGEDVPSYVDQNNDGTFSDDTATPLPDTTP